MTAAIDAFSHRGIGEGIDRPFGKSGTVHLGSHGQETVRSCAMSSSRAWTQGSARETKATHSRSRMSPTARRTSCASNDEVERRRASPASNEGTLSQSSTLSLAHRRRDPRSLQPIVRSRVRQLPTVNRRTDASHPTCRSNDVLAFGNTIPCLRILTTYDRWLARDFTRDRRLSLRVDQRTGQRARSNCRRLRHLMIVIKAVGDVR